MNKKDLMEMIREVIAQEMGSNASYEVVLVTDKGEFLLGTANPDKVDKLKTALNRPDNINKTLGSALSGQDIAFTLDIQDPEIKKDKGYFIDINDDDQKIKLSDNIRNLISLRENKNKTKMKVNQLRQIIREEIENVMNKENSYDPKLIAAVEAFQKLPSTERMNWSNLKSYKALGVPLESEFKRLVTKGLNKASDDYIKNTPAQKLLDDFYEYERERDLDNQYDF